MTEAKPFLDAAAAAMRAVRDAAEEPLTPAETWAVMVCDHGWDSAERDGHRIGLGSIATRSYSVEGASDPARSSVDIGKLEPAGHRTKAPSSPSPRPDVRPPPATQKPDLYACRQCGNCYRHRHAWCNQCRAWWTPFYPGMPATCTRKWLLCR